MKRVIIILILFMLPMVVVGQDDDVVAVYDNLLNKAKSAFKEQRYEESNRYYTELIALLEKNGHGGTLVPTLKEQIALNNMYMASPYVKGKEYGKAIELYLKSVPLCTEGSKVYKQLHSSMGVCYSVMSFAAGQGNDVASALEYCEKAEECYVKAGNGVREMNQRVSHANILISSGRNSEANTILNDVLAKCSAVSEYKLVYMNALCILADLEYKMEDFRSSIRHAEQAYEMAKDVSKSVASSSAGILWRIYDRSIPDAEKAAFWKGVYDENREE